MPLPSNYPQTATYWAKTSVNKFNEVVFLSPVQIPVRWEKKRELFMDSKGKQILSNSVVYPLQELILESYLALGAFSETNPADVDTAFEVKMQSIITNLKGTKEILKIWL